MILGRIQWMSRLAGIEQFVVISRCPVLPPPLGLEGKQVENRVLRIHRIDCEVRSKCVPDYFLQRFSFCAGPLTEQNVLVFGDDYLQ